MRVRAKLTTMTLFVAVIPLAMSASQSIRLHETALDSTLFQLHAAAATLGARVFQQEITAAVRSLKSTVHEGVAWDSLSSEEKEAALWLIFSQFQSTAIATLSEKGITSHRVYRRQGTSALAQHPVFSARDVDEFEQVSPPGTTDVAVGAPMLAEAGVLVLPLSLSAPAADNQSMTQVSVGFGLTDACSALLDAKPATGSILLLDAWNRELCRDGRSGTLAPAEASLASVLQGHPKEYSRETPRGAVKGALASCDHGFRVVVEQPVEILAAPSRRLRWQALFWLAVGVAAAAVSGRVLGRDILNPLESLAEAARRVGQGHFGERLDLTERRDEFSDLATAFGQMASAIAERDAEINAWNAELKARVAERGRQLEQAQQALFRSQKMAGLAVATAGIAHEMNNPLTGVLGLAQVLTTRLRKRDQSEQEMEMLGAIIESSKRMQTLLQRMESLDSHASQANFRSVSLAAVLDGVTLAARERAQRAGVSLLKHYTSGTQVFGDPGQLSTVFAELVDNALKSFDNSFAADKRRIELSMGPSVGDWIEVVVADTGRGIQPEHLDHIFEPFFTTKPGGVGDGLGLAHVYRVVVREHGGSISVESEPSSGTRVIVRLYTEKPGVVLV